MLAIIFIPSSQSSLLLANFSCGTGLSSTSTSCPPKVSTENCKTYICLVHNFTSNEYMAALMVKTPPAHAGHARDVGSIPGSGRSPGVGNGNLLHSCLENSMDRGAWQATVPGATKCQIQLRTDHSSPNHLSAKKTCIFFYSSKHE